MHIQKYVYKVITHRECDFLSIPESNFRSNLQGTHVSLCCVVYVTDGLSESNKDQEQE